MTPQQAFKKFLIRSPFYGFFLLGLHKEIFEGENQYGIDTAGVGILPGQINITLFINLKFWNSLKDDEQLAILEHECNHITFGHLSKAYTVAPHERKLMNIAKDCAINQYATFTLPKDCITLETIKKLSGVKPRAKESSFYYFNLLQQLSEDIKQQLFAGLNEAGDDHSLHDGAQSDEQQELIDQQIDYQIKNAAEQPSCQKAIGNLPGQVQERIAAILNPPPPVFDWKKYFRRVLGNILDINIKSTRMKPSKRFDEGTGIKRKKKTHILVGVDTSGSVSNEELQEFWGEIEHIYKAGTKVTIAEWDTQINGVHDFKPGEAIEVSGRISAA